MKTRKPLRPSLILHCQVLYLKADARLLQWRLSCPVTFFIQHYNGSGVTLFGINMSNSSATIYLESPLNHAKVHQFSLTPKVLSQHDVSQQPLLVLFDCCKQSLDWLFTPIQPTRNILFQLRLLYLPKFIFILTIFCK